MSLCKYPRFLKDGGGIFPCGRCLPCRINKRMKKATRLSLEGMCHEHAAFVGLTYMDEFLPKVIYDAKTGEISHEHPNGCLDKLAIQKFYKRLKSNARRRCGSDFAKNIRFFAAGEYGEQFERPHYHLVIWNIPPKHWDLIKLSWRDPRTKEFMSDPDRITIEEPRSMWDVGNYCCAYVMKNNFDAKALIASGRPPEFTTSSLGIGAMSVPALVKVFQKHSGKVYIETQNDLPRCLFLNGKKMPIDRYLREKLLDVLQEAPEIKVAAQENFEKEMREMHARAVKNPQIPASFKSHYLDIRERGKALEMQYQFENAQAVLNIEKRHSMFKNK